MIKRELAIFLVVGFSAVLIDFISYRLLIGFQFIDVDMAKALGFLTGTFFAYFANCFWTFGHKSLVQGSAWRFSALYMSTLGTNVSINAFAIKLFDEWTACIHLAFLLATAVSACLNFLGMKHFVFRPIPASEFQ